MEALRPRPTCAAQFLATSIQAVIVQESRSSLMLNSADGQSTVLLEFETVVMSSSTPSARMVTEALPFIPPITRAIWNAAQKVWDNTASVPYCLEREELTTTVSSPLLPVLRIAKRTSAVSASVVAAFYAIVLTEIVGQRVQVLEEGTGFAVAGTESGLESFPTGGLRTDADTWSDVQIADSHNWLSEKNEIEKRLFDFEPESWSVHSLSPVFKPLVQDGEKLKWLGPTGYVGWEQLGVAPAVGDNSTNEGGVRNWMTEQAELFR